MVIKVRSTDGPNLFIPIPTVFFCNRLTAGIAARVMAQNGWSASPAQMLKLFRVIRKVRRRHPEWVLVEVQSANGDSVFVKL